MKGFISYAHDDRADFVALNKHLKAAERALDVTFWADERLVPGDYWSQRIADEIEDARVHLLLFSPSFIAADYIFDHELPAIESKCARGDLILPVVLKRCSWDAFVRVLHAAPRAPTGRVLPVREWRPAEHGYDAVREQLMGALCQFGVPSRPPFKWGGP